MRIPLRGPKKAEDAPSEKDGEAPPPPYSDSPDASLQIHPAPTRQGLVVKVSPPKSPPDDTHHVPSDIVLVIDVSGSMGARADVPGEDPAESTGLSVLDLVKHASLTVIETMNENDRLGIVTFSSKSTVVQALTPMTKKNKDAARKNIKSLQRCDATNLWHGILDGVKVVKEGGDSSRVPAVLVLTDGMPNHMCPPTGYVPKLKTMMPLPATIHTFGFGYSLRSGLLKSIAEIGGGNYAFIPDAGMIGTVFVHAVANLQTTYATDAVLKLQYAEPMEVNLVTGKTVDHHTHHVNQQAGSPTASPMHHLTIPLGNLQFGQSRDIFLKARNVPKAESDEKGLAIVQAELSYNLPGSKEPHPGPKASARRSMLANAEMTDAEAAYHESRAMICNYLLSLSSLDGLDEYHPIPKEDLPDRREALADLIKAIPAAKFSDPQNASLMDDLAGKEPKGQISLATSKPDFWLKWGCHYIPSLLNAHTRQICNTFKDPGPLQYGTESPLFLACRDRLDSAFDNLPPPEPTLSKTSSSPIVMSRYHNSSGVCFAASTPVELASGETVAIRHLKRGMSVRTPLGSRKVALVLRTPVREEKMCRIKDVIVTPWHPISSDGKRYIFPAYAVERPVSYSGAIYSILLQWDADPAAHAIRVGGFMWGVSLGHGITSGADMRAHEFFGNYEAVAKSLLKLSVSKNGRVAGNGVVRDAKTGDVTAFRGVEDETETCHVS